MGPGEQDPEKDAPAIARLSASSVSPCPAGRLEALIVESDARYRDHVLAPGLMAMGFTRVHKAAGLSGAQRIIEKHDKIGVVVTDACLKKGQDGMAVCRMTKNAAIPVVLLAGFALPRNQAGNLVDTVIYKKKATVLQTVREARKLAA